MSTGFNDDSPEGRRGSPGLPSGELSGADFAQSDDRLDGGMLS